MSAHDGLAHLRRERQDEREAPVSVGVVDVLRSDGRRLQVQSGALKPAVRMWLEVEWLHSTSIARCKGDCGELVLKRHAAEKLGLEVGRAKTGT